MLMRQRRLRRRADRRLAELEARRQQIGEDASAVADRWHDRLRSPAALPLAFAAGVVFGQLQGAVTLMSLATKLVTDLIRFERMAATFTVLASQTAERVQLTAERVAQARAAGSPTGQVAPADEPPSP